MHKILTITVLVATSTMHYAMENQLQEELAKDFKEKKEWFKQSNSACTVLHQLIMEGDLETRCMYQFPVIISSKEILYESPAIQKTFRELRKECAYEMPVRELICRDDRAAQANEISSQILFNTICSSPNGLEVYKELKEKKNPEGFIAAFDASLIKTFADRGIKVPSIIATPANEFMKMLVADNRTLRLSENIEYYKKLTVAGFLIGLHLATFGQERSQTEEDITKNKCFRRKANQKK